MRKVEHIVVDNPRGSSQVMTVVDRISILDVYANMVRAAIYQRVSGKDAHHTPERPIRDFLIRNRIEV